MQTIQLGGRLVDYLMGLGAILTCTAQLTRSAPVDAGPSPANDVFLTSLQTTGSCVSPSPAGRIPLTKAAPQPGNCRSHRAGVQAALEWLYPEEAQTIMVRPAGQPLG
jgi:hypothetical protein